MAAREPDFHSNKDTEMLVGASLATFVDLGGKESDGLFNQRKLGHERIKPEWGSGVCLTVL